MLRPTQLPLAISHRANMRSAQATGRAPHTAPTPHSAGDRSPQSDDGFTLIEVIVAVVIIAVVIIAQASLLVLGAQAQTRLSIQRAASGILQTEIETFQAAPWDDLMMAPDGSGPFPALCELGDSGLRSSAQIIRPEAVQREENVVFTITRNVTWTATGDAVTCDAEPNDRGETKTLTITISWTSDSTEQSRTAAVIISRHRTNQKEVIL